MAKNGTFYTTTFCNGQDSTIVTQRYCTLTMLNLQSAFGLVLNDYVVAKVRAKNAIDWSAYTQSSSSSGAQIKTVPLAPSTTVGRGAATDETQIEMTWSAVSGTTNTGGETITQYEVYWDYGSSGANYVLLYTDSSPFQYTYTQVTTGITSGTTYKFKYRAVNQ